jgi:dehydrogenase/reductase SDR family member 1
MSGANSKKLEGRVAWVTGASRGIGKGVALELGAAGATVYVSARHHNQPSTTLPGTAAEVAQRVTQLGGHGIALSCDHADDAQVQSVVDTIAHESGRLDILVNSAMATTDTAEANGPDYGGRPFWEAPLASWDKLIDVGLRSNFIATALAMPLLLKNRGLVVNISAAGAENYYLSVHYGVQKAGTDRMIRDMAYEARDLPVTFIALWPGFVRTELITALPREHLEVAYAAATLHKRKTIAARSGQPVQPERCDRIELESQRFAGMAVLALATDANVKIKSGRSLTTVGCALEYGYTDSDGTIPDAFGFRDPSMWYSLSH